MRRYNRIYTAGTQRAGISNFLFAAELCHSGRRQTDTVHANTLDPSVRHDWLPAEPEPPLDECDWDLWLGPTPCALQQCLHAWRLARVLDFHAAHSGWGRPHGRPLQLAGTNDTLMPCCTNRPPSGCIATYANGLKLVIARRGLMAWARQPRYEGEDGWVETGDSGRLEVSSGTLRAEQRQFTEAGTSAVTMSRTGSTHQDRRPAHSERRRGCDESHHLPLRVHRLAAGPPLEFDPVKSEFPNDTEATGCVRRACATRGTCRVKKRSICTPKENS